MTRRLSLLFQDRALLRQRNGTKMFGLVAIFTVALLGACQPKVSQAPQAAIQSNQPDSTITKAPASLPQATTPKGDVSERVMPVAAPQDKETAAAGSAKSLAGGWVNAGGACDSGASVFFNADGTYMSEGEKGTWTLAGKTLTVTTSSTFDEAASSQQGPDESTGDSGEKAVLTLLSVTDDAAKVVLANGSNASWTRCNS